MNKKIILTVLLMIVIISLAVFFRASNQGLLLQGEVDAPEVIVTSKAKGRVIEREAQRGDDVRAGEVLMRLEAPELIAQLKAAEAARDQAKARLDLSLSGTREESLRNLRAVLASSTSDYQNARDEYNRQLKIAAKGYISAQALDDARNARNTALQSMQSAQANLDEGLHGDRAQQREIYAAQLDEAEQQLLEIKAQTDDLVVRAPVDGEVGPIPAEVGDLLTAYSPLLTLVRLPDAYFVFNLREDILAHVRKGDIINLRVPALNNEMIKAEVHYIAPLGDFSTKSATRATGDFDLKTFEVRLRPLQPVKGLRQGMSALWQWK
ncbi:membrane fusion component of a tripartite multidrug resistance system [Tatumella ptyseos ATCC 33301]|uniref:Membrane fusion component of a tripartite multidrug resistance system n=2 Tax=Tatumella ptyseos TaxID=82987 RepID=A0A085JDB7_9GAMM|nr:MULTISPECIES: efflux RND transporter periplasmic adaptor subunit [Tatumella]KFD18463.1 membrane fusion component of a tripartite multidrug resistance system [Tatumella ptyseos ATCC 33301]